MEDAPKTNPQEIRYPTVGDIIELSRIIETKSNSTNTHRLARLLSSIKLLAELVELDGWNEDKLKTYNRLREEISKLLLDLK